MNEQERRFVAEYLVDFNATAAARRAGYPDKWIRTVACRLLRRKEIAAAIATAEEQRAAQRRITGDRVLEEYARIAFADMRSFLDWGPDHVKLRHKDNLSAWEGGAIAAVEPRRNGKGGRLRLHDKHAALEMLARHIGLFDPSRSFGRDQRNARRDARAVLVERLKRMAREDEPQSS